MNKIETITHVYERFAKGDAPAILAAFEKDIEFRLAEGHPYAPHGTPWIGGDAITRNFFVKAGAEWRDWRFDVHQVIETPDTVVVEQDATPRSTALRAESSMPRDATSGGSETAGLLAFISTSTPRSYSM